MIHTSCLAPAPSGFPGGGVMVSAAEIFLLITFNALQYEQCAKNRLRAFVPLVSD